MSKADELLKYKQLLDSGAITQEEYTNAKEEIMAASEEAVESEVKEDSKNQSDWNQPSKNQPNMNSSVANQSNMNSSNAAGSDQKDSNKIIIFTTIFVILLWPVGLIYTLVKKPFKKNTNIVLCIWYGFMTVLAVVGIVIGINYVSDKANRKQSEEVAAVEENAMDLSKYADLTGEQIKELFGEPDNIDEGNLEDFITIPVECYEYGNNDIFGDVTFVFLNNKLIKFDANGSFSFDVNANLFDEFGLVRGEHCAIVTKTDTEERYRCPSDLVDEFWMSGIDAAKGTFTSLKVIYDMKYFEEWYVPMSMDETTQYQNNTQDFVKSILKSPDTAQFPDITEWSFGKNDYYVAVQSYVNAYNSEGELGKREFTFIYKSGTQDLIYATYDGKQITEGDYEQTAEIIIKLLSGTTSTN